MEFAKKCLNSACGMLLILFVVGGCASTDVLSKSDISVEELERRMTLKNDPSGNYRKSKSFRFVQTVKIPQFLDEDLDSMVETKMVVPDKFRITTFEDNKPQQIICSNGRNGWMADAAGKKLKRLEGAELQRLLTLSRFSTPDVGYKSIFKEVKIFRCSNEDGEFYLLDCTGRNGNTFKIYVDAKEFLLRRMSGKLKFGSGYLNYDSRILGYGLYDGVMIPKKSESVLNGQKQIVELVKYELNVPIPDRDFLPPVF